MECDTCARDTAAPAAFAKYCAAETRKAADAGDYPASPIRPHAFRALRPRPCDACGKTKCVACYRECRLCHKIVCVACVSADEPLPQGRLAARVYDADAAADPAAAAATRLDFHRARLSLAAPSVVSPVGGHDRPCPVPRPT